MKTALKIIFTGQICPTLTKEKEQIGYNFVPNAIITMTEINRKKAMPNPFNLVGGDRRDHERIRTVLHSPARKKIKPPVPRIMLEGAWLNSYGFKVGDKFQIKESKMGIQIIKL
jgi:hypothetical protein